MFYSVFKVLSQLSFVECSNPFGFGFSSGFLVSLNLPIPPLSVFSSKPFGFVEFGGLKWARTTDLALIRRTL